MGGFTFSLPKHKSDNGNFWLNRRTLIAKKGQTKANAKPASVKKRAFNASPEQKKHRAARNTARRQAIKAGTVKKGGGKDVGHKQGLAEGGSNDKSNRRIESASANRKRGGAVGGRRSSGGGRPRKK